MVVVCSGGLIWRSGLAMACCGLISDLIVWYGGLMDWFHGLILRST